MRAAGVGRGAAALRGPEASATRPSRARVVVTVAVSVALSTWTLLILVVPSFSFSFRAPDTAIAILTTGAVVSILIAALAYIRYSLTRRSTYVFVAVAFAVLATNQFVFGIVFRPGTVDVGSNAYLWLFGRLVTGAFLVVGALQVLDVRPRRRAPLPDFLRLLAIGLLVLACGQAAIVLARDELPRLVTGSVDLSDVRGVLPGITPADVILGSIGAAGFAAAAILYLRLDVGPFSAWLPPALVIAAFSHVHYMLMPTIYSARISTGDLLRVAFASVLLIGLIVDVRETYVAERERRYELDAAYRAEVERVAELEEADRARADLLSLVTHELLHPVAAIRSNVLVLARRWEALDEPVRRDIVDRLELETRHLVELAERVPSATRLDRSPFTVRPQEREVGRIVRDAVSLTGFDRPLEVALDGDVDVSVVNVDPVRIAQVFRNLLSNADKFSPPGRPVRISAWKQPGEVVFCISDSGFGIDLAEADRLFEPFRRGPTVDRSVPGSGLGLYVVKGIVDAHGGRIWAGSTSDGGAAFTFTITSAESQR
jgi:signal transduction histidine kinase